MKKQWLIALIGVAMTLAIAVLWLRVRDLENSVDSLTRRLQSKPGVFAVRVPEPARPPGADGQKIFKLIESAKHDENSTNVGVPWDVERAMMGEGRQNEELRNESIKIEAEPVTPPLDLQRDPLRNIPEFESDLH